MELKGHSASVLSVGFNGDSHRYMHMYAYTFCREQYIYRMACIFSCVITAMSQNGYCLKGWHLEILGY